MTTKSASKKSRPRSPAPAGDVLRIFQIHYLDAQRTELDPAFTPLSNGGATSHLLEFDVFRRLHGSSHVAGAELWGALSWKFRQKTGLTGEELRSLIQANPGYDCYFCNPHPEVEAMYHNLWIQGEVSHPNFLRLSGLFLEAAGLPTALLEGLMPSKYTATANYFVASPRFWDAYLTFVGGVLARAEKNLPPHVLQELYSTLADPRSMHADAGYWPFLVERLLSVFLLLDGKKFKAFKFPVRAPHLEGNVHCRLLGQMKDAAWESRSNWLAVCWVNYRNLYLSEVYGKEWVRRYLPTITPGKIIFLEG